MKDTIVARIRDIEQEAVSASCHRTSDRPSVCNIRIASPPQEEISNRISSAPEHGRGRAEQPEQARKIDVISSRIAIPTLAGRLSIMAKLWQILVHQVAECLRNISIVGYIDRIK